MTPKPRSWSDEDGIALVLAMFMVLLVSLIGASLVNTGRTETLSSLNYKSLSQARYAAESGLHTATNYLLYTYVPPGTDPGDPLANYDMTVSPVKYQGKEVLLTSDGRDPNYPMGAKKVAFNNASHYNDLRMNTSRTTYSARARLLSMKVITDAFSNQPVTLQTWEVTGIGSLNGAGASNVEVTAILERQSVPAFRYAAFATYPGCASLTFGGGGTTNSYNSTAALSGGVPVTAAYGGNVGTNGNLAESGSNVAIQGSLSTPRSGVGDCTSNNVTAVTLSNSSVPLPTGGLTDLPQTVVMPDPAVISPMPPTTSVDLKKTGGCPGGVPFCSGSTDGVTFTPTNAATVVSLGNVNLNAGAVIHVNAGIYEWNSIKGTGNAQIVVDSGPVIFRIAGKDQPTPIDLGGGIITNTTFKPENLQFVFAPDDVDKAAIDAGTLTKDVKFSGGSSTSMLVYAPKADGTLVGGSDLYGAVTFGKVKDMGGTNIHYDRNLQRSAFTSGNPTMTSFSWSSVN